jgi:uncharacterized RDD family membrane protein YckC
VSEEKTKNYYEMLGVSFYASSDDLRRGVEGALRRTESIGVDPNDPLVAADIAAKKRPIMQAYMTLKDPERRREYNASLTAKTSETGGVVAESKAFAIGAAGAATTGNTNASHGVANADAVTDAGGPRATAASSRATQPLPKYEAVDLRSSMQQRLNDGEVVVSLERTTLDEPAHLGVRFVAMLIDSMIVMMLWMAFVLVGIFKIGESSASPFFLTLFWLIPVAYYAICESGKHRSTWGKRWMGLRVYRGDGETPVGLVRGAARYALRVVSSFLLIGYIIAFFSERKQALHDIAADAVVFQTDDPPAYWLLAGIASVIVVPAAFVFLGTKFARGMVDASGSNYAQIMRTDRVDPNGASPTTEQVQLAYRTGLSMQSVLRDYYAANKQWPQAAQRDQLIDQSARPQLLRDHELMLLPKGVFSLSLGATPIGTARMIFQPNHEGDNVEWACRPIKIARDAQIAQCRKR